MGEDFESQWLDNRFALPNQIVGASIENYMTIVSFISLCLASMAAGMVNSIAGGGTLLTFPVLVWVLGPSPASLVIANATSTTALLPGSLASAWGYRKNLSGVRNWTIQLLIPSLLGAAIGTWLVAQRDPSEFQRLIPWLILLATLLFLFQPTLSKWTGVGQPSKSNISKFQYLILSFQFLVAVYGGYFGAGIGILMLSSLALMGLSDIHQMNGIKTILASAINSISVVLFIWFGLINWLLALPMIIAAIIGGYIGARTARRFNKNVVRYTVIVIGFTLSIYYFAR